MVAIKRVERPLSPHLQIYRWQVPMLTSILTRITGNALIVSAVLVVWWLLAASGSASHFAVANGIATSWFGDLVFTLSASTTPAAGLTCRRRKSWAGPVWWARSC